MACSRCAVINSYIDQMHEVGFDSQAIAGWNSTGPWLIDNNFLEAGAENIIIGGAQSNMGQPESDITITHNYIYKPMSWDPADPSYAGTSWSIKNLLELKMGVRVLVEGNVFQNSWTSGQSGRAITINPTTSGDSSANWTTASDLTFAYSPSASLPPGSASMTIWLPIRVRVRGGFFWAFLMTQAAPWAWYRMC